MSYCDNPSPTMECPRGAELRYLGGPLWLWVIFYIGAFVLLVWFSGYLRNVNERGRAKGQGQEGEYHSLWVLAALMAIRSVKRFLRRKEDAGA